MVSDLVLLLLFMYRKTFKLHNVSIFRSPDLVESKQEEAEDGLKKDASSLANDGLKEASSLANDGLTEAASLSGDGEADEGSHGEHKESTAVIK